ncbi:MAG: aryl-sulfate sulfotransferase, partial [Rhodospirillales bacterium]|nr:aryl-sulfate sulfotransferase [Rhodospirillales bacterium]
AGLLLDNFLLPDAVVEIEPIRPKGGRIVWEWHAWDHLVKTPEAAAHPELIDPNASPRKIPAFWNHMNSIDYNPAFDQILLSVRGSSEIWIIDHSTTTAQAAGHTGGKYGKGGDLLFRWGNPSAYYAGKATDQMLYEQHDAQWIEAGRPGAGNITVFNNGVNRPGGNLSSADEFTPPVDASGRYTLASATTKLAWTYAGLTGPQWYESDISGAYRLPNGNTLLCYGTHGVLVEVTAAGEIVWQYVNPVVRDGPMYQGDTSGLDDRGHNLNAVFRARRYPPDYAGLAGRTLNPKGVIELSGTRFVNGASFQTGATSPGAILTVMSDTALAAAEASATATPLPTQLGGVAAEIKDSAGATHPCGLYYASARQLNLVIPDACACGAATLTIRRTAGGTTSGPITVDAVAPGLFTLGSSGIGAITGLRISATGQRTDVPIFRYDTAKAQFLTAPIDLGTATDQVYLSLYGTGLRFAASVSATIGGVNVPVQATAALSQFPGMDQVNL